MTHAPSTFSLAVLAAGYLAAGCYSHDDAYYYEEGYPPDGLACYPGVDRSEIDRGAILALEPGGGAGASVEYLGDGLWRVAVTCDGFVNPAAEGVPCFWDVVIGGLDRGIEVFEGFDLESNDVIEWYPSSPDSPVEDAVRLESLTDVDVDSFTFEQPPGDGVWVSARLDGACGATLLVWLDGGRDASTELETVELIPEES
jgi:hypothetical protein